MRFQRRRPKWPFAAGLCLLLALTIAAPWSWQRLGERRRLRSIDSASANRGAIASSPSSPQGVALGNSSANGLEIPVSSPVLPPLVEYGLTDPAAVTTLSSAPSLGAPIVRSDEYDEFCAVPFGPSRGALSAPSSDHAEIDRWMGPISTAQPIATDSQESLPELSVTEPSVTTHLLEALPPIANDAPAAPSAPRIQSQLHLDQLLSLRDRLLAFLKQASSTDSPTDLSAKRGLSAKSAPQVRVESDHDRLAMALPRRDASTDVRPHSPSPTIASRPDVEGARPVPRTEPQAIGRLGRFELLFLQILGEDSSPQGNAWKEEVLSRLSQLEQSSDNQSKARELIDELSQLAHEGLNKALKHPDAAVQRAWLRGCRALSRRLPLWHALTDSEAIEDALRPTPLASESLRENLDGIDALLGASTSSESWRRYLRTADIAGLASVGAESQATERRQTARDILTRMADESLNDSQRQFVASPPCKELAASLRAWATGPVDLMQLAAIVERYEAERSPRDADSIAEAIQRLQWSSAPALNELAQEMEVHYRNPNVRLAASREMFNRLLPKVQSEVAPVRDRVAGTDVRGRSKTNTQLEFLLHEDAAHWALELTARGTVRSRTYSDSWPARVRNAGNLQFQAHKMIRLGKKGVAASPAVARAQGTSDLVGVNTQFDPVPLVGILFQDAARSRHRERQPQAIAQVKTKVAEKARLRLDEETSARLQRLDEQFRSAILVPLQELAVTAEPVEMHSTRERAVMRLRMADSEQLAACTPRPAAPSDSLVSIQLHESALTNVAAGLQLDGRKMTVEELYRLLASRLRLASDNPPDDLPGRAIIQFASTNAVSLRCDEDQIRLTLRIASLARGRDAIRNVDVHAHFRPETDGLAARLVRDGTLQFEGENLRTGTRMVLHGVFNKLIPKDEPLQLITATLKDDPRWADLMVTQLVIEDGWVGIALGPAHPKRIAWRTSDAAMLR